MKYYSINELSMISGLTTRSLRNYIKMDILHGEKIDGVWRFTEENISEFISDKSVKPSIAAKSKAIVFDTLANSNVTENESCVILNLNVSDEEAKEISSFFCDRVNESGNPLVRFFFEKNGQNVKVILSGPEDVVSDIMIHYYA